MNRLAKHFMFLTPDGILLFSVTDSWDKWQKLFPAILYICSILELNYCLLGMNVVFIQILVILQQFLQMLPHLVVRKIIRD